MNWSGNISKPTRLAEWRSPPKRISTPRSVHPCANYKTTPRKSVLSIKSHPSNTLHEVNILMDLLIHPPKRVAQEVKLPFRYLADSCLLLVDRELQLAHDLAQSLQRLFGFAPPTQDHEIVGVGHDA